MPRISALLSLCLFALATTASAQSTVTIRSDPIEMSADTDGMVYAGVERHPGYVNHYRRGPQSEWVEDGVLRYNIQTATDQGVVGVTLVTYDTQTNTIYEQFLGPDGEPIGPVRFGPIDPSRIGDPEGLPPHPNLPTDSAGAALPELPEEGEQMCVPVEEAIDRVDRSGDCRTFLMSAQNYLHAINMVFEGASGYNTSMLETFSNAFQGDMREAQRTCGGHDFPICGLE